MLEEIKGNIQRSLDVNPNFDASNIGKDNTIEDKIFGYALKLQQHFKIDLSNLYDKLKTFNIEYLSKYDNDGLVSYDASTNTGKISLEVLKNDANNDYNIDSNNNLIIY